MIDPLPVLVMVIFLCPVFATLYGLWCCGLDDED